MPVDLSPGDQLCLLLARARFSPELAKPEIERLATANWDTLFEHAWAHGLIPLVYHRLQELDFPGVPPQIRRELTDAFGINAIRNEVLTQELIHVLADLGEAEIPVIPLKGVALAESLYGDVALRICADLDILIRPEDFERGLRVLRSAGYRDAFAAPPSLRLLARLGRDCALVREDGRWIYPLQVHCGLVWGGPPERGILAEIWARASVRIFQGAPISALSPADEFLYLAVHAARHGLSTFKWITDLDWIVNHRELDWQVVLNETRTLGWYAAVGTSLAACASLFGTPVPEPLTEICSPAQVRLHKSEPGSLEILRQTVFVVRLLPSLSKRILFIATRLFIPTAADSGFVRLPSAFFFLYFLLRPCRLMFTALKWLVQAVVEKLRGSSQPLAGS